MLETVSSNIMMIKGFIQGQKVNLKVKLMYAQMCNLILAG